MKHPHAELMQQYAEDAMETDKPWELWESGPFGRSFPLTAHPAWDTLVAYRRKPEPEEILPPINTPVWVRDDIEEDWTIAMFVGKTIHAVHGYKYTVMWGNMDDYALYRYMTTENPYKPV